MSAETVGWVFRHSPMSGADLVVHLAIADTVNDANGYELWTRVPNLAQKARVHAGSVRRALAELVEAGLLEELDDGRPSDDAGSATRPRRFLFLMPSDEPVRFEGDASKRVRAARAGGARPAQGARVTRAGGASTRAQCAGDLEPKVNPTDNPRSNDPPTPQQLLPDEPAPRAGSVRMSAVGARAFDRFWQAYPLRVKRPRAEQAWVLAIRRADPLAIIAAAERHASDPNREDQFTRDPHNWLADDGWNDSPERPRGSNGKASGADQLLAMLDRNEGTAIDVGSVLHHGGPDPKGLPR